MADKLNFITEWDEDDDSSYTNFITNQQQPTTWPEGSDQFVDELQDQQDSLIQKRNKDRLIGAIVTAFLCAALFTTHSGFINFLIFVFSIGCATTYITIRVKPRRHAIEELQARLSLLDPRCKQCGYNLRHLRNRRCPECGRRVLLPTSKQLEAAMSKERVTVASGSISSELGWVVGLIMVLFASIMGKCFGWSVGWYSATIPPMFFVVLQIIDYRRQAGKIPPLAICNECSQPTSVLINECTHCHASMLAQHVYVKPGLRGPGDPRLYNARARILGAACICSMLMVIGSFWNDMGTDADLAFLELILIVLFTAGILSISRDQRLVNKNRLKRIDRTPSPLCHNCLRDLTGLFANDTCPSCKRTYTGMDLVGGINRHTGITEQKGNTDTR